jgi:hypothetical protein
LHFARQDEGRKETAVAATTTRKRFFSILFIIPLSGALFVFDSGDTIDSSVLIGR